ncbi:MAG: tripartite tricarboxylate transporter substrate binding protein [Betaproteobacteria bacterium]|nr:tripartite tricarboxylate transporter substrate binding protein [Betaproteobacteria bacterium]
MSRAIVVALMTILGLAALPVAAAYPERPIEIIFGFPPGNDTDSLVRLAAATMSKRLGVPVAIINKPGGGGVVGGAEAARAKPDGYTVGLFTIGSGLTQIIAGNTPYKFSDLAPVGMFISTALILAARGDAGYKDLKELARTAKQKPPVIGIYGPAGAPTLVVQMIAAADGWSFKGVPFPNPNFTNLQSGDAELITAGALMLQAQIKSGQVRVLVAMTPSRIPGLPDVPTVSEAGYGPKMSLWSGLMAPAGTPKEAIQKLSEALAVALKDPGFIETSTKTGNIPSYMDPEVFAAQIKQDEAIFRPIMEKAGLIKKP